MKVRRRPMPLTATLRAAVDKGQQTDPRRHTAPPTPNSHVPKMRGVNAKKEERPVLYTKDGYDQQIVNEERMKAHAERVKQTRTIETKVGPVVVDVTRAGRMLKLIQQKDPGARYAE